LALGSAGCRNKAFVLKGIEARVDGSATKQEREGLLSDASRLMDMRLEGISDRSLYASIFGGSKSTDVLKFLDLRLNYVLGRKAKIERRLTEVHAQLNATPSLTDAGNVQTIATNIGVALWMVQESLRPVQVGMKVADQVVPLNSSRVGIIQLGGVFAKMPSVARQETLVHESRHSDCTGGVTRDEIKSFLQSGQPTNRSCGHLHVICPASHELAGHAACDGQAWGAYAIGGAYSAALSQSCANCSETEKQLSLVIAADSLSRVLVLDAMMEGRLGQPDMSSAGVRN
jgi:hypothetical protein